MLLPQGGISMTTQAGVLVLRREKSTQTGVSVLRAAPLADGRWNAGHGWP
jgi:hypothetical protein